MEKNKLIKMIVILGVVGLFMLQYVGMGFDGSQGSDTIGSQPEQYTGIAVINATIDYYERSLLVFELDYETMKEIEEKEGVKEVIDEGQNYRISLSKKEDVVPLYYELSEMGITSYATAKITLDPSVTLVDEYGNEITGYFYNRKIKVGGIEPIFPEESTIAVQSQVAIQNEQAYVGEMSIYLETAEIEGSGLVLDKKHFTQFTVEWAERDQVYLELLYESYGEENVSYVKNNQILFSEPLSVDEQIAKKFEYVDYISAELAIINENFTDVEEIKLNFGEDTLFMNSTLIVIGAKPEFEFYSEEYELYDMEINLTGDYILREELVNQQVLYDEEELELGTTIGIKVQATVTGNNVISVEGITVT